MHGFLPAGRGDFLSKWRSLIGSFQIQTVSWTLGVDERLLGLESTAAAQEACVRGISYFKTESKTALGPDITVRG